MVTKWTQNEIKDLLEKSDTMVKKSVVKIFEKQTEYEQSAEITKERNGVGFNAFDAEFGTSIAKKVMNGYGLTEKQISSARKMMKKYSGQLVKIANGQV